MLQSMSTWRTTRNRLGTSNLFFISYATVAHAFANWLKWVLSIFYRTKYNRSERMLSSMKQERRRKWKCKHSTCWISGTSSLAMWNSKTNRKQGVCVKMSNIWAGKQNKINWIFAISRLMKFIVWILCLAFPFARTVNFQFSFSTEALKNFSLLWIFLDVYSIWILQKQKTLEMDSFICLAYIGDFFKLKLTAWMKNTSLWKMHVKWVFFSYIFFLR